MGIVALFHSIHTAAGKVKDDFADSCFFSQTQDMDLVPRSGRDDPPKKPAHFRHPELCPLVFSLRTCFMIGEILVVFPCSPCMMGLWKTAADSGKEETL